ncbi:DNA-binding response regulator [Nitrospira sp.]|nr:DNA-binding response regulator [Nitrospira sp.]
MTSVKSAPISVLFVDDHELVIAGIQSVLRLVPEIRMVGEAQTAADAVREAQRLKPDVVLLDIRLPDGSGIEACREILATCPHTKVLFLTSYADDDTVRAAVLSGAQGYVLKDIRTESLVSTIKAVAAGQALLDPSITKTTLLWLQSLSGRRPSTSYSRLSPQEERILPKLAEGKTNKEIAVAMNLSEKTVKNYLANIFDKLGVTRRSQAAAFYVQQCNRTMPTGSGSPDSEFETS